MATTELLETETGTTGAELLENENDETEGFGAELFENENGTETY